MLYTDTDMEEKMQTLSKKTTILFSPKIYRQLEQVAKERHTSVGQLVRQAAIQCYLVPDKRTRLEAVQALAAMQLPVGNWYSMKDEIEKGRSGR